MDPKIEADTHAICETQYSFVRLMNDKRWPWIILLPRNANATELHHLSEAHRMGFLNDVNHVSELVQQHTRCQSVNIAMLGNMVSALHCHVVARDVNDPNWPKPIWGFENAEHYTDDLPEILMQAVERGLGA